MVALLVMNEIAGGWVRRALSVAEQAVRAQGISRRAGVSLH